MCIIKFSTLEESLNVVANLHGEKVFKRFCIFLKKAFLIFFIFKNLFCLIKILNYKSKNN